MFRLWIQKAKRWKINVLDSRASVEFPSALTTTYRITLGNFWTNFFSFFFKEKLQKCDPFTKIFSVTSLIFFYLCSVQDSVHFWVNFLFVFWCYLKVRSFKRKFDVFLLCIFVSTKGWLLIFYAFSRLSWVCFIVAKAKITLER